MLCRHAFSAQGDGRTKVTLLTQLFPPETQAGANRAHAMAEALAEEFEVTVVTLYPSYPTPEFFVQNGWHPDEDDVAPYRICRITRFEPHEGGFLRRGAREMGMTRRLASHARRFDSDLIISTSPTFFLGPLGLFAARMLGTPFVWDVRDVTWRYVVDTYQDQVVRRGLGHLMSRVASITAHSADLAAASNVGILAELNEIAPKGNYTHAPNGVTAELLKECEVAEPSEGERPFRVTYAGALGYYQGLNTLVEVAERMPDVEFVVAGEGPERAMLQQISFQKRLQNIRFPGYLERDSVVQLYADSDILYASLRDSPALNRHTMPSKPFEYMAAGRPVLYVGSGIAAEFVSRSGGGVTASHRDVETIVELISGLRASPVRRRRLGAEAARQAKRHDRGELMQEFTHELSDLLRARENGSPQVQS